MEGPSGSRPQLDREAPHPKFYTEATALQKKVALLLAGALLCGVSSAIDTADMEIYVDYPVGMWDFVSDGPLDKFNTQQVHSYEKSVRIDLNGGQVATMFHTWHGEYTQNVVALGFWIYSQTSNVNNVRFQARIRNQDVRPEIRLGDFVNIPANTWTYVQLPLQSFYVVPGEPLHYTYFKTSSNIRFWIDDVKLVTVTPPLTPTISVNPSVVKSTVSERSFGAGIMAHHRPFAENPETWALLREAGVSFFNFPGGVNADYYNWRNSTNTFDGTSFAVTTMGYLNGLNQIGAKGMISVNYGSGTPQDAADWVQYANVQLGGNIKYWSIGNEPYHPAGYDIRPDPFDHDADTYAQFCVQAIQLMKAVDPTIKIGVSVTPGEWSFGQRNYVQNPRTGEMVNGWSAVLLTRLRQAGVTPDYLDFHLYAMEPGKETDAAAFQMVDRMNFWTGMIRQMIDDYLGAAGANVKVNLTETNSVWGDQGKMSTSLTNALYLAHQWGTSQIERLDSHVWWNVYEQYRTVGNYHESLYGWREYTDRGLLALGWPTNSPIPFNTKHPTFYAMKMLDKLADPGDQVVACSTDSMLLKAYAVKSPSGRIRVMVINIAKERDVTAQIAIAGVVPPQFVTIHRYGVNQDLEEGDIETQVGYAGSATFGAPQARTFTARFNRYSISVIEL
jgi:hypothetical protein